MLNAVEVVIPSCAQIAAIWDFTSESIRKVILVSMSAPPSMTIIVHIMCKVKRNALINQYGISPAQLTRLRHNEGVNTHTIDMFCRILDCEVGEIMRYVREEETE